MQSIEEIEIMKRIVHIFLIILFAVPFFCQTKLFAVDYPIISFGINGGYGQSPLAKGASGRAFLRYSLEAYIPGFQIEIGYASSFYTVLKDTVIQNPDETAESRKIKTGINDGYPVISGTFHLSPFGESTTIYFGGGGQFHLLSVIRSTTDRYWDDVAEKYQETEIEKVTLLDQTKFGFHLLGGVRIALGKFGSLDFEARQTFVNVSQNDWQDEEAKQLWGEKKWDNFSANVGLTIYIF